MGTQMSCWWFKNFFFLFYLFPEKLQKWNRQYQETRVGVNKYIVWINSIMHDYNKNCLQAIHHPTAINRKILPKNHTFTNKNEVKLSCSFSSQAVTHFMPAKLCLVVSPSVYMVHIQLTGCVFGALLTFSRKKQSLACLRLDVLNHGS